jgi:CheY-like chemotaxis protein
VLVVLWSVADVAVPHLPKQASDHLTAAPASWLDSSIAQARIIFHPHRGRMSGTNKTVLLVEDNEDNLVIYSTILRHSGYTVIEARDGQAGIDAAHAEHPDIILMDVSIPLIDGWEATRRLKADPATASIPIIALTAHALAADQQKAVDAGCDGYIPKPAEPRVVLAAVRRQLGEVEAA